MVIILVRVVMRLSIAEYLGGGVTVCRPGDYGAGLGDAGGRDVGDSQRQRARLLGSGVNGALQ